MHIGLAFIVILKLMLTPQQLCETIDVQLPDKTSGLIFSEICPVNFTSGDENLDSRFTPAKGHIFNAEQALLAQFNSLYSSDPRLAAVTTIPEPSRAFKHHFRQYFGYISTAEDSIIFMNLLNFKKRKQALKHWPDYRSEISFGFGDWYEANQNVYCYNLCRNQIFKP